MKKGFIKILCSICAITFVGAVIVNLSTGLINSRILFSNFSLENIALTREDSDDNEKDYPSLATCPPDTTSYPCISCIVGKTDCNPTCSEDMCD